MAEYRSNQPPWEELLGHLDPRQIARFVVLGIVILVVAVGVFTSTYTVAPEGKVVVKRFGKVVGEPRAPGLHFKRPFFIDRAYFVPTERVHKQEFGFRTVEAAQRTVYDHGRDYSDEALMLTGDLNVIIVPWVVQYRISDPDKYLHRVRNQTETIRVISETVMRRIVGNRLGSDVLTVGRVQIANLALEDIKQILADYDMGVRITTVELKGVSPPKPVEPSYNDVNEARQDRERQINEAEKNRNKAMPRAEGEARQTIAQAEGYLALRVNRAKGEAERFKAIYEQYRQAPQITRRRLYLEMIDQILPRIGKLYVVEEGHMAPIPLLNLGGQGARLSSREAR